ncbi:hypothetical protein JL720_7058 [Aureococcus anophagefferens]|nr:hypothetical protein JL720_7058 [Aureococcus anophagefferens]
MRRTSNAFRKLFGMPVMKLDKEAGKLNSGRVAPDTTPMEDLDMVDGVDVEDALKIFEVPALKAISENDRRQILVTELKAPLYVGEGGVFTEKEASASVLAFEDCRGYQLAKADCKQLYASNCRAVKLIERDMLIRALEREIQRCEPRMFGEKNVGEIRRGTIPRFLKSPEYEEFKTAMYPLPADDAKYEQTASYSNWIVKQKPGSKSLDTPRAPAAWSRRTAPPNGDQSPNGATARAPANGAGGAPVGREADPGKTPRPTS